MDRLYYLTEEQFTQLNRLLPPEDSGRGPQRSGIGRPWKGSCTSCAQERRGVIYPRSTERGIPLTCAGNGGWSAVCGGIS
jgi:hypothetical protein